MTFLHEPGWWLLLAASMTAASIPSAARSLRTTAIIAILSLWAVLIISTGLLHGFWALLTCSAASFAWGILMFLLSLLFTGIRNMTKQRYGGF
jgi:hypothetical protein